MFKSLFALLRRLFGKKTSEKLQVIGATQDSLLRERRREEHPSSLLASSDQIAAYKVGEEPPYQDMKN